VSDHEQRPRSVQLFDDEDRTVRRVRVRTPIPERTWTGARYSAVGFAFVVVGAFPFYIAVGRRQWFVLDDWDFLANRSALSTHDLFRPHNEHWSTLPILAYRALFNLVGLRYLPYQMLLIALHLTAATLLWKLILRAGVQPWIAAITGAVFVLFGSGNENILWAFQIGFVGSLVFGFAHLLLADHDGPLDRSDALAVGCGIAALLCSGVGVTMVVIAGIATLLRRGWKIAVAHVVPPALVFGAWFVVIGRVGYTAGHSPSTSRMLRFVTTAISATFGRLGYVRGGGLALGILLIVGLPLAWATLPLANVRSRSSLPIALLLGAFIFLFITAKGRAAFSDARQSRYFYLTAAMTLPALAVAADAITRRWRAAVPVVVAALLVGIPGNLEVAGHRPALFLGAPKLIAALPRSPLARKVPRTSRPDLAGANEVTIGWLLDGLADGRVPSAGSVSAVTAASATILLAIQQSASPSPRSRCRTLARPANRTPLKTGDVIHIKGQVFVALVRPNGSWVGNVGYASEWGSTLKIQAPITLRLVSRVSHTPLEVCS
jgi:hypothetical protein